MDEVSIASAIVVSPEADNLVEDQKTLKRRHSEEADEAQESKRTRISPGKNSPPAARDDAPEVDAAKEAFSSEAPIAEIRGARRKHSIIEEKQRNKRLFGALTRSLNQPGDRTSKRRQEIESRKKAELQRQDDERAEDKLRRQEKLAEQRRRDQERVDEDNMHIRHRNLLNMANFLQTETEPRLYYRPWDLRPDEEERIEAQIKEAQNRIDRELDEFDQRHQPNDDMDDARSGDARNARHSRSANQVNSPEHEHGKPESATTESNSNVEAPPNGIEHEDEARAKSDASKPAEALDVEATDPDTNTTDADPKSNAVADEATTKVVDTEEQEDDDQGIDGDKDAVIY